MKTKTTKHFTVTGGCVSVTVLGEDCMGLRKDMVASNGIVRVMLNGVKASKVS